MVVSELYTYLTNGKTSLGRMVRWKDWKYYVYSGIEEDPHLYQCSTDPNEENNVANQYPEVAERLKAFADSFQSYEEIMVHERWAMRQLKILQKCNYDDPNERWQCPELPELEHPVCSRKNFGPTPWVIQMRKHLEEM